MKLIVVIFATLAAALAHPYGDVGGLGIATGAANAAAQTIS